MRGAIHEKVEIVEAFVITSHLLLVVVFDTISAIDKPEHDRGIGYDNIGGRSRAVQTAILFIGHMPLVGK